MECRYCRTPNAEDDHRCQRCGRRLRMTPVYTGQSAAAPDLRSLEMSASSESARPVVAQESAKGKLADAQASVKPRLQVVAYQPSLFGSRDMPFELLSAAQRQPENPAGLRPVGQETAVDQKTSTGPEIREARLSAGRSRARKAASNSQQASAQQRLEFSEVPAPSAEPAIYCDAPVAITAHRLMAAALDGGIILLGMTLFLASFYVCVSVFGTGGGLAINKQTLPLLGGIAVLFAVLYNILWALGNEDTAGMAWARLRLVNFDGQKPDREQRLYRLASGCLSFMAAGLGLLWALVDEESLTWHDHMSKTFPTPY